MDGRTDGRTDGRCQNHRTLAKRESKNWSRYLDDCFIPIPKNLLKPSDLLEILNSINPSIQFTMEADESQLPFLDILINKSNNNEIWMDIYHKETDTRRCVSYDSCHPKHCLTNIPYTLARRICTIVENEEKKKQRLSELKIILQNQSYPENSINIGFNKALNITQSELRKPKDKPDKNNLTFITTHNPNNKNVLPIIQNSLSTLKQNESTKEAFQNIELMPCYRQPPSLKKLLTKACYSNNENFNVTKCGDSRCKCCPLLKTSNNHIFKTTQDKFILKSNFDCNSSNLVYVVICSNCKEEYIGETGENAQKLRDRMRVYRQQIREPHNSKLKITDHLRHCSNGEFQVFPFFQLRERNKTLRQEYEHHFRKKFKPTLH